MRINLKDRVRLVSEPTGQDTRLTGEPGTVWAFELSLPDPNYARDHPDECDPLGNLDILLDSGEMVSYPATELEYENFVKLFHAISK